MTQADSIRQFVNATYIQPARAAGQKQTVVRVGDVHSAMKLKNRLPAVAGALGATLFEKTYRVKRQSRVGPQNGASLTFTFNIEP